MERGPASLSQLPGRMTLVTSHHPSVIASIADPPAPRPNPRRQSQDRDGFDHPLVLPETAIDPCEPEVSINAAMAMRVTFAQDSPAVLVQFDALAELATWGGKAHWMSAPTAPEG